MASPLGLLVFGSVLIVLTFMRYSLTPLGWVVFAPLLACLHQSGTARRHLAVLGALVIGFLAAISKMATSEIHWAPPVPMFAVPIALSYFSAMAVASLVHRRVGTRAGVYTFAAMTVVMGWIQYTLTPGSSWGVLAHTELNNLPLMQVVTLTGIGGITFLLALGSSLTAAAWHRGVAAVRADVALFALLVGAVLVYGQLRLGRSVSGPVVRVAGVVSPVTHDDFRAALTDLDRLRALDDELFARSARAVDLGARVVVWNEMATVVSAAGEGAFASRGQAFARERGVLLLMAYGVAESMRPFHDANKYRVYLPDGSLADEYIKRHPVPGDPDDVGQAHARVVVFEGVKYSGAICYDYGFPAIARDNARDGADLALVPSSDWRGIDPQHGQMAIMNAVAAGLPLLRPVRAATTTATDPFGRVLGSLPAGSREGVLVVSMSAARVPTLYASTGELVPVAALTWCAIAVPLAIRGRRREDPRVLPAGRIAR